MFIIRIIFISGLLLTLCFSKLNAQISDLSGIIYSVIEDRPLAGANIRIEEPRRLISANDRGEYQFRGIPNGNIRIQITYVGFVSIDTVITISGNTELNFYLRPSSTQLDQILISERALDSDMSVQVPLSTVYLPPVRLRNTPRVLGEPDLVRVIQNLPGVKAESDFSGGFQVRGGRNDQNLILLDGMPLYSPWHLFGLMSTFNSEAVSGVEFSKGVFPVRYGGRLSSVLNIGMADGEQANIFQNFNFGVLSSTLSMGTPIGNRSSVLLTARRTYMEPVFSMIDKQERRNDPVDGTYSQATNYYFMDLNMKLTHTFSPKLFADVNLFFGNDVFAFDTNEGLSFSNENRINHEQSFAEDNRSRMAWNNVAASIRLMQKTGPVNITYQLYSTRYVSRNYDQSDFDFSFQQTTRSRIGAILIDRTTVEDRIYSLNKSFNQSVLDIGYKQNIQWQINPYYNINTGFEIISHQFIQQSELMEDRLIERWYSTSGMSTNPPNVTRDISQTRREYDNRLTALEGAFYFGFGLTTDGFNLYPGLRAEYFDQGNYLNVLPRINAIFNISPDWDITMGYGHFSQYFHTVGLDLFTLPLERWMWSSESVKPAIARTFTVGTRFRLSDLGWITAEYYSRHFDHLQALDPVESFKAFNSTGSLIPAYRDVTVEGIGRAYGVEISHEYISEYYQIRSSYTLSWNRNRFDAINHGEWFDARTDSRHDANLSIDRKLSYNWQTGLFFSYKTGQPMSMAFSGYAIDPDPLNIGNQAAGTSLIWANRNNYRLPDYHRLDVYISLQDQPFFGLKADYTLNVVNVYNRINVFAVNVTTSIMHHENNIEVDPGYRFLSQLPVLPMISLRVKQ